MDFNGDKHLDVCQNLEVGLKRQYELNADLTHTLCIFALDGTKTAIRKHFGYAEYEKAARHRVPLQKNADWRAAALPPAA